MSILTENWHTWYIGDVDSESNVGSDSESDPKNHFWANLGPKVQSCPFCVEIGAPSISPDSESRLRLLKFQPVNPFLGKFGPKESKLSVLSKNWYAWYLKDAGSYFNIIFLNFKS